ncbi:MAG TPA: PhpK family radical SAM P-methyltransferase [Blastocatellia bacterium]
MSKSGKSRRLARRSPAHFDHRVSQRLLAMPQTDCLILGFYDYSFSEYVSMLKVMGADSGAFQDLSLAFVEVGGRPLRALDLLTELRREAGLGNEIYHNADFLWPVVAYLTTYLRRSGLNADYVNLPHLETERLRRKIAEGTRAVAITTTLYVSPHPILALVEMIRSLSSDVKIIVGGPYIANQMHTANRSDLCSLFDYLGADIYVTCAEGEKTLTRVLRAMIDGEPLDSVSNLAFRNSSDNFTFTMDAPESNALQENIIDYAPFFEDSPSEFLSIRTAKSCPFACAFCGFPERAGDYRYLDVASVEKQLNLIRDLGRVTTITFLDDTFNVPKGRFKEVLRMMIRNRYDFRWNCFYRSDHGDEETIDLMGRAGCEGVFLGVESGSDRMLSLMNKAARRRNYAEAIPRLHAAGISTYASLIIGFPGETDETVRETIDFLEESAPEYFRAQLWYADPVTPVWKKREEFQIQGVGFDWIHHTMSARRACEWIERMFLSVENSMWLPQFGFEQWSTFYLARKGMSRAQIRNFVGAFNGMIKHRLLTRESNPPQELMERARQYARFETGNAKATTMA